LSPSGVLSLAIFSATTEHQQTGFRKRKKIPHSLFANTPPLAPAIAGSRLGKESCGDKFNRALKNPGLAAGVFANPFRIEPDNQ